MLKKTSKQLSIWCNNPACFSSKIEDLNDSFALCAYTTSDTTIKKWFDLFDYWYSFLDGVEQDALVEQARENDDPDYEADPKNYRSDHEMNKIAEAKLSLEELRDLCEFD